LSFAEFRRLASQGNLIPLYREILADFETPVSAFAKIDHGPSAYLLESVEGGEKWARYSFLGSGSPVVIRESKGKGKGTVVVGRDGRAAEGRRRQPDQTRPEDSPLDTLAEVMATRDGLEKELGELDAADLDAEVLEGRLEKARDHLFVQARELSQRRTAAAGALEKEVESKRSRQRTIEADIVSAEKKLELRTLRAPVAGLVSYAAPVVTGDRVAPDQTVFTISASDFVRHCAQHLED